MSDLLSILIPIALAGVVIILLTGVVSMVRGGAFNRQNANRLMRWRVIAQLVAILLIFASLYLAGR